MEGFVGILHNGHVFSETVSLSVLIKLLKRFDQLIKIRRYNFGSQVEIDVCQDSVLGWLNRKIKTPILNFK